MMNREVRNQITPKFTPKKHVVFCIGFENGSGRNRCQLHESEAAVLVIRHCH
jgi:hypothetical protein